MAVSFFLATLGCKVNQYESHSLRESWLRRNWRETDRPERADVILVNSCAVTANAVADVRSTVRRLHRAAPEASIIVTGCAAEVLAAELADLPGVTAVVGQSRKDELAGLPGVTAVVGQSRKDEPADGLQEPGGTGGQGDGPVFPAFTVSGYDRSRAVLKVQDGCSHGCTYCIVPRTRGRARSRDFDASLSEAGRLLEAGFREIVLSGVNLRQYGRDFSEGERHDFWDLLVRLERELGPQWAGRARLRISSLEPGQLGQKALEALASSRLTAPHLHLSLQSGSPSVLRRMGRGHYDPAGMTDFFAGLREIWPVFGLGADFLTAFPGESDEEFREGLDLCRALPLTYAHVFPYSRRPGTAAASMAGQVSPAIKKERAAVLRAMVRDKKQAFLESLLGVPEMRVVLESREEGSEHFPVGGGRGAGGVDKEDGAVREGKNDAERPSSDRPVLERGVNEFYADCRLDNPASSFSAAPLPRELTRVRPVRAEEGVLVVSLAGVEFFPLIQKEQGRLGV